MIKYFVFLEYIIEDPSLLEEIKPSSRPIDSTSSTTGSDDEQQQQKQSLKNKFAQIKAKFEQKNSSNVMASRSTSSATTSSNNTTTKHQNSRKQMDDLYARHRRASNESIPNNNNNNNYAAPSNPSIGTQNSYYRSQSIGSEKSKTSSFRRFNSADEADEEVSRIHRQGEELLRHNQQVTSMSPSENHILQQSHAEYEILDEDGKPMAIDGVQDLIKMSGVRAREVPQPDGTIIKEYVIDDPQLLSQFRSQQQQQQQQQQLPMTASYIQQRSIDQDAPPPPPRVPLRPPVLFRQGGPSMNDNLSYNIQQIHVLEPQRRYEYLTTTGRRVQFFIINSDSFNGQLISDSDIRELTNAINLRLLPSFNPIVPPLPPQQQGSFAQTQFNLPKQWYPSVNLTHRQRIGSDGQPYSNNFNTGFQPMQTDLPRSTSSNALNQGSYYSQNQQQQQQQVFNEPINQSNTSRYQDSHNQLHQTNETFQSSAQFLPQQQMTRSTYSPPIHTNHPSAFHQQSTTYPYQGQQQHGVRIFNDFNQQRTAIVNDGNTRI